MDQEPSRFPGLGSSHRRHWVQRGLLLAITLALIAALLSQISPADILAMLANLSWPWAFFGLGWYIVTNLLRAVRFRLLLAAAPQIPVPYPAHHLRDPSGDPSPVVLSEQHSTGRGQYKTLVPITFVHSMFNGLLGRSGELSFIYLVGRRLGVGVGQATAVILLARLLDLIALASWFLLAALTVRGGLAAVGSRTIWAISAGLLLSAAALAVAPWFGEGVLTWLTPRVGKHSLGQRILKGGRELVGVLAAMRSLRVWAPTLAWSLVLWTATFAWLYSFMTAVRVETLPGIFIIGATFGVLSKALPLVTLGGFGAHEAGWTLGFLLVGLDRTTAIASGFAVNILILLVSLTCGLPVLLWLGVNPRSRSSQQAGQDGAPASTEAKG